MKYIVSVITGSSFVAIVLAAWHEYVFYTLLDPALIDLPQTRDYLPAAMRWLPLILFSLAIGAVINLATARVEGGKTEEEIVSQTAHPRFWRFARDPVKPLLIVGCLGLPVQFMIGSSFADILLLLAVMWIPTAVWISGTDKASKMIATPFLQTACCVVPALFIAAAANAAMNAELILDLISEEHNIFLEGDYEMDSGYRIILEDDRAINHVMPVRNMTAGMLVAVPLENRITFLPWGEIQSVDHIVETAGQEGHRLCRWFGAGCF